jgi:hypothetical protein
VGCRRLGGPRGPRKGALDLGEFGLALNGDKATSALPQALHLKGRLQSGARSSFEVFNRRKGTMRRWPFGQIASKGRPLRPQTTEPGAFRGSRIMSSTVAGDRRRDLTRLRIGSEQKRLLAWLAQDRGARCWGDANAGAAHGPLRAGQS